MAPNLSALGSGDPDSDDDLVKSSRLAARAARFNNVLPGNRYKELEEQRSRERKVFEKQGLITSGKTELGDAVDMRGTCEGMCSEYEIEFREYTKEIHPFEATPNRRMDHAKAVTAYTRSDAGAGHGEAAVLPSDLRTPAALVRSLDYLINQIMPINPPPSPNAVNPPTPTPRKALGYSAGFIRDRTRAIRKEFAMQSSWGQEEAIASYERIARWHILCLRELQEETGSNTDMHIDSAELGRCFTSLRQQYNDRREELGVDLPCANEPEFRAYMLIFDLAQKSVSIPTAELPSVILDHPLVRLAWQIRQSAQRNFDSQKEGSKFNAEFGANLITRFVRLLRDSSCPFLLACLVEIRLREVRRSALRALTRTYPRLRADPIRVNDAGQIVERRMVLIETLDKLLGCEEQEEDESAWDDVEPVSRSPDAEAVRIAQKFQLEVYKDHTGPVGALINLGAPYNDNRDAPFTRRWKLITAKRQNISYADIVNGRAGTSIGGYSVNDVKPIPRPLTQPTAFAPSQPPQRISSPASQQQFKPVQAEPVPASKPVFAFNPGVSAFAPQPTSRPASSAPTPSQPPIQPPPPVSQPRPQPIPSFFSSSKPQTPTTLSKPVTPPPFSFASTMTSAQAPRPAPDPISQPAEAGPSRPTFFTHPSMSTPSPPSTAPRFTPPLATPPIQPSPAPPSISKRALPTRLRVDRDVFRRIVPALRDQLVGEVVDQIVELVSPDIEKYVRQQLAAQAYATARDRRQHEIERFARLLTDFMFDEQVDTLTREAIVAETRVRGVVARAAKHWRAWTQESIKQKELARQEREDVFAQLSKMGLGLGKSTVAANPWDLPLDGRRDQVDEMELDVELRQAERSKDELYEPGSFLVATARHVAPILKRQRLSSVSGSLGRGVNNYGMGDGPGAESAWSETWQTVILDARSSTSPAPADARKWLASKFQPREDGDIVDEDGIEFTATVKQDDDDDDDDDDERMSSGGDGETETGLIVLEAPLVSLSTSINTRNTAEAAERMETAIQLAEQSRYKTPLLIVTWEDETLDEVIDRLDIRSQVEQFSAAAVVSLEDADNLTKRFVKALRAVVRGDMKMRRYPVTLDLGALNASIRPGWEKLVDLVRIATCQTSGPRPADIVHVGSTTSMQVSVAIAAVRVAIDVLNSLEPLIEAKVGCSRNRGSGTDPPIKFPLFPPPPSDSLSLDEATDLLVDYFSQEPFNDFDEIALELGTLRRAATHTATTSFDVSRLVQVLGLITFGTLEAGASDWDLEEWEDSPAAARGSERKKVYAIATAFEELLDEAVEKVATAASAAVKATAAAAEAAEAKAKAAQAQLALEKQVTQVVDHPAQAFGSPPLSGAVSYRSTGATPISSPWTVPLPPSPWSQTNGDVATPGPFSHTADLDLGASGFGPLTATSTWASGAGTKRSRDDSPKEKEKESKAAKNARLLRALAEVSVTLNQIEQGVTPFA